jgi:hypothetical protein
MSRASSPIFISSRDSTLTPEPNPNLVRAQIQALAEASRPFFQDRLVNLGLEEMTSMQRAMAQGAIIGHWANLFRTPISEVIARFRDTPSIAQPLLEGGSSPPQTQSPTLQYLDNESSPPSSTASTPPLSIPPPGWSAATGEEALIQAIVTAVAAEQATTAAAQVAMDHLDIIGPNRKPMTPTDPVPPLPSSPPPFLAEGPIDSTPDYEGPEEADWMLTVDNEQEDIAVLALLEAEEEERERTPSPSGPQPGVHPGPGWFVNFEEPGCRYAFCIPNMGNQREVAPFIQIDWSPVDPELLGTMGRSCPVYARSLHACADEFPRPAFDL